MSRPARVAARILAVAFLVGLAWGPPTPAAAQEDPCVACHVDVTVAPAPHGDFSCTGCHGDVDLATHPAPPLPDTDERHVCATCHDTGQTLGASVHAGLACGDCHGPAHAVSPVRDTGSPVSPVAQIRTCGGCHASPPSLVEGYLKSVHAFGLLRAGLASAPSCSACHGSHSVLPVSDPRATTSWQNVPHTCGSCHEGVLRVWADHSAHGLAWTDGDRQAPVCTTCHSSHRVVNPVVAGARLKTPEGCGGCHAGRYSSYRDSFHGTATELGFLTAATCSDCHTPHENLAASDPASSISPSHLATTCGQCHGTVSASFTSFDPHADPRDPEVQPAVHLTWLFMTALLVGVFGFFGVHDLLWLQRSAVGALRGEFGSRRATAGPYIRRFTPLQVGLHVVVVVTFLLLAATGLPLKFHDAPWARPLADVLGGLDTTRWLHRVAAAVTFGYFAFHVGNVAWRMMVRGERGLLWGWNSMVPRPEDVRDLFRNVRYFLYLGPRPRFDRWTYWEKFDYFAVFWGVVVIGLSGLLLWFPGFFTRFLPGWTLNAAFVIHSEEALLAVGFIFVFHFFHTHLRPESFPLDPVVFVGRVPLERFREERAIEYERLRERGELERCLEEPPTPSQLRAWRIFGFLAMGVGLALALAIVWNMILYGPPF